MDGLTIGDVAKRAKVHIETLRYYERQGLVPRPRRSVSNYRVYAEDTVRRVRFIKSAQELGFSLKEIRELLSLRAAPKTQCWEVRERAEAKIEAIEAKIASLQAMKQALAKLVAECSGEGPVTECPILESIEAGVHHEHQAVGAPEGGHGG
ncbi:MAG TPA: heavy metal-responsive transcriptional regulator [Alphaproteobacteria bacterium]|nr:heavy metal-responsive transcriptional regulator [Alphaproteobacteria bacterium]